MASKITYTDKEALYENPDIEDINKVNATDMNEIKRVVNENADLIIGEEVAISTTEPTGDETIWINPDEASSGSGSDITNNYSNATDKAYSANYVNNNFQSKGVEVWTNPDISTAFDAQIINIDLSSYSYIHIICRRYPVDNREITYVAYIGNRLEASYSDYDNGMVRSWNRIMLINSDSMVFTNNTINGSADNKGLIPYKIIGYK